MLQRISTFMMLTTPLALSASLASTLGLFPLLRETVGIAVDEFKHGAARRYTLFDQLGGRSLGLRPQSTLQPCTESLLPNAATIKLFKAFHIQFNNKVSAHRMLLESGLLAKIEE